MQTDLNNIFFLLIKIAGYYIFDVTSAVERWIAQSAKPKQQLIAIEKEKIPVKIKRGDREYQLGVLPEGMYYYLLAQAGAALYLEIQIFVLKFIYQAIDTSHPFFILSLHRSHLRKGCRHI